MTMASTLARLARPRAVQEVDCLDLDHFVIGQSTTIYV